MSEYRITLDTRKLDEIAEKLKLRVDQVMMRAAYEIEREAKYLAPYVTGALKNSIATERVNEGNIIARVGPHVVYGARVEFGFHGSDSLGRVYHQAARPYLLPAAEIVRRKYSDPSQFKEIVE